MIDAIPRRRFLRSAGVALAGAFCWDAKSSATAAAGPTSSTPRLFPGCCAYSYEQYLEKGRMTMEDFILKGVELGVHGVDITTYWLKSTEPAYLTSLRHFAYKNGMPFSGAAIRTDMCEPDPAKRAGELEKIKQWLDATDLLGASHLRVFGGDLPAGATLEQGIQWVVEVMKPACDYAGKKGITLGLENHGGITARASTVIEILRRVNSPYTGFNLDFGNFTEDHYAQIEQGIPYASHTHVKGSIGKTREPIDHERIFKLFARAGYRGYMSVEYEDEEDPMTGVPKLVEKIKALSKKYSSV